MCFRCPFFLYLQGKGGGVFEPLEAWSTCTLILFFISVPLNIFYPLLSCHDYLAMQKWNGMQLQLSIKSFPMSSVSQNHRKQGYTESRNIFQELEDVTFRTHFCINRNLQDFFRSISSQVAHDTARGL